MDNQGELFAGRDHPETSKAILSDKGALAQAGSDERVCLSMIRLSGEVGRTSDELSMILGQEGRIIPPNQVASRVLALRKKGYVKDSGETRLTRRDRKAIVWRAV